MGARSSNDQTPPRFGGLLSATTCAPGARGALGSPTRFLLRWRPASDNETAAAAIRYDVYQLSEPGQHSFGHPTYTTVAGVTSFTTPPLPAAGPLYFVVRSRDSHGNSDKNTAEHEGRNLCR